jgi:hypothetical protein
MHFESCEKKPPWNRKVAPPCVALCRPAARRRAARAAVRTQHALRTSLAASYRRGAAVVMSDMHGGWRAGPLLVASCCLPPC